MELYSTTLVCPTPGPYPVGAARIATYVGEREAEVQDDPRGKKYEVSFHAECYTNTIAQERIEPLPLPEPGSFGLWWGLALVVMLARLRSSWRC